MNETSTKLLIFSAGCLTGATIAYSILKTRFEAKNNHCRLKQIGPDNFGENGFHTQTLYYHMPDASLVDGDGNIVGDGNPALQLKACELLDDLSRTIFYVRDESAKMDFEIIAVKEEFDRPCRVRMTREEFEFWSKKAGIANYEPKEQPDTLADAAKSVTNSFADLSSIFKVLDKNEEETIYPITADEYGEQGYDEEQLYFYAADETLADKDDCVVDPDETNVGDNAIDIFLYTDTENTYIRNNETKTDYEIIKVNGSYASVDSEGLYE